LCSRDPFDEILSIIPNSNASAYTSPNSLSINGSPPVSCNHNTPASRMTRSNRSRSGHDNPSNVFNPR